MNNTETKAYITIDNESQPIPIKNLDKLFTYISIDGILNTALNNDIEIDAHIYFIKDKEDVDIINDNDVEEEKVPINNNGAVLVTIYKDDKIHTQENIRFTKGHIKGSIKNTLPLGNYKISIDFLGNKYYAPSNITSYFNVEKREGICTFSSTRYYADALETFTIAGNLKDTEKETPVSNCTINYEFNGETNTVTTDNIGNFFIELTMPEPNIEHCNVTYTSVDQTEYDFGYIYNPQYENETWHLDNDKKKGWKTWDSDIDSNTTENTIQNQVPAINNDDEDKIYYPQVSYLLVLYTDNESYHLNNTEIEIIANKIPTKITVKSTNTNISSGVLNIYGNVLGTYYEKDNNVQYGKMKIELPDFNYVHKNTVNINDGIFSADINLSDVYQTYNISDIDESSYDVSKDIDVSIIVDGDIYDKTNQTITVGDSFTINAKVTSSISSEYVKYGVLIFKLFKNKNNDREEPFYQYATEIDRTGMGIFNFNTSKEATYYVGVEYVGMFGYKSSESLEKYEVRIG